MENQISQTPTGDSPQITVAREVNLKPKKNNYLILLLSVLLVISCVIAGFFAYQTQRLAKELQGVKDEELVTPTQIPTPIIKAEIEPESILTEDWETYTNIENGYSLKFPKDQYIRLICTGEELTVTVRLEKDRRSSPIVMGECSRGGRYDIETKTYLSIQKDPEETKYYDIDKKDILIDGIKGKLFIHTFTNIEDGPYPRWFAYVRVYKNNKTYEIYFGDKDKLDLFYQILSTFKFTN